MFTVLGKGNSDVGGFTAVLNASLSSGRIELIELHFNDYFYAVNGIINYFFLIALIQTQALDTLRGL